MDDHERAMLTFAKLAGLSQDRGQLGPRDKFLVLAAVAATQGLHPRVAAHCRTQVLAHNPAHLLKRFETIERALSTEEFQGLLRQLAKFCSYEKAEHLLSQLGLAVEVPPASTYAELDALAFDLLKDCHE
jgi:hypothetical protein